MTTSTFEQAEADRDFWRIVLAYFIPPLGVLWQKGPSWSVLINVALTLFFYVPGMLHALWVITNTRENGQPSGTEGVYDFWRILIASVLPPLGVFLQVGLRGAFWLNILLWLMFYVPGVLHAVWVITHENG